MFVCAGEFINGSTYMFEGTSYFARFPHMSATVSYFSLIRNIFDNPLEAIRFINIILSMFNVILLYFVAKEIFNDENKSIWVLFLSATGQLMWKLGIDNIRIIPIGFLFYGLGAIFMIRSLKIEKITVAYPIMCMGYIVSMVYGYLFLDESITINKIIAIGLIIIGVCFNGYDK